MQAVSKPYAYPPQTPQPRTYLQTTHRNECNNGSIVYSRKETMNKIAGYALAIYSVS